MLRRLWFDTEFHQFQERLEDGTLADVLDPIAIALVDKRNNVYSAVFAEFNFEAARANPWLSQHILPRLPPKADWKPRAQIKEDIWNMVGSLDASFRYWYAPQDALIIQRILGNGRKPVLPENAGGFAYNIAQKFRDSGMPNFRLPENPEPHNWVADARWARDAEKAVDVYMESIMQ